MVDPISLLGGIINKIFNNNDAVAAIIFCVSAGTGQVMHGIKKWSDGDSGCIMDWFTKDLRRTVGAIAGNIGMMIAFVGSGVLGPIMTLPNGWWSIFIFGFMNGFSTDSALNKAKREEWSAEKREHTKV